MSIRADSTNKISEYGLNAQLPEVFDATMISDFTDCPSKFYLRHVLGLLPKGGEEAIQLAWGTAWHKLHELYHGLRQSGLTEADAATAAVIAVSDNWPAVANFTDRNGRTKERMMQMFIKYLDTFRVNEERIKPLRAEQFFDIYCPADNPTCPFGGCDLRWSGRIDRIVEQRGKILIWDYKTTSAMGPTYFDRYEHSFQLPGYFWTGLHMVPQGIDGVRLDVLYTLKNGEDMFQRTFKYVPQRILEWRDNTKQVIQRIQDLWTRFPEEPEMWEKNWGACTRFGHCMFTGIHFTPPIGDTRLRIMEQDYIESRWNPAEVD